MTFTRKTAMLFLLNASTNFDQITGVLSINFGVLCSSIQSQDEQKNKLLK